MPYTRIVLRCPGCGHSVTDPIVILTVRQYRAAYGGTVRFGCIACQRAGREDQVLEEQSEDCGPCISGLETAHLPIDVEDLGIDVRLRRLEAAVEALRQRINETKS